MPETISIIPYLESESEEQRTLTQKVNAFAHDLRNTGNFNSILHANKLMEYLQMTADTQFLDKLKYHLDQLYQICVNLGILFLIDGRRKTLKSLNTKIQKALYVTNSSLDLIRDIFAFRIIILDSQDATASIKMCYEVMNKITPYLNSQGLIPCESIATSEKFDPKKYPNIIVPNESYLDPQFKDYVKDYIKSPKEKGYQSLHESFRDSSTGRFFEVQIRLASMHIWAEHYAADHTSYKEKKYDSVSEKWDLSKIHADGFYYIPAHDDKPATYEDFIGLVDHLIIYSRRHIT